MNSDTPNFPPLLLKPGRYALGLSGGADSTYLARTLARDRQVEIHLVHINHQLRGAESDEDERFCRQLASELRLPLYVAAREAIEPKIAELPQNPSARYREIRLHVFKEAMALHHLDAVLLAHHANDQAETVLLRLMRGGGLHALGAMRPRSHVRQITVERPLLAMPADLIRARLREAGYGWREDSSNESSHYRRNAVRKLLATDPALVALLVNLANHAQKAIDALDQLAPSLAERFPCSELAGLPGVVAEHAARRWLVQNGSPSDDVSTEVCVRLVEQATHSDAPPRRHYPGKRFVRRRKKHIEPG